MLNTTLAQDLRKLYRRESLEEIANNAKYHSTILSNKAKKLGEHYNGEGFKEKYTEYLQLRNDAQVFADVAFAIERLLGEDK